MIAAVPVVITASKPSWTAPFSGLSPHDFRRLLTALRRKGTETVPLGRPVKPSPEDRVLPVAAYRRRPT